MREYGRCDLGSLRAIVEMVLACTLSAHRNADGHLYLYVVCMYVCSIRMFDSCTMAKCGSEILVRFCVPNSFLHSLS